MSILANVAPDKVSPDFSNLGRDVVEVAEQPVSVTGTLPAAIRGTLFRNGPGRFTRGGRTKRTLLDGDGVVQRLAIADGKARYTRKFVATPKLAEERAADRFLSPTWTSKAPGLLTNIGQHLKSQAGVTVYNVGDKIYALDEVAPGYELDPHTLETVGPVSLELPDADAGPKAHARRLASSGDWLFASTRMGRDGMMIDIVRRRHDGSTVATPTVRAPRMTYVHDFVATETHALFVLHAAHVHGLRYMMGLSAFTECLEWRPSQGNLIVLVELASGRSRVFEAPAAWVWHLANGYEADGRFVADFVGYDDPGHFLGEHAQLAAIMLGRAGDTGSAGTMRRYAIDLTSWKLTEEVLDQGNFDFCSVDPRTSGLAHRRIFATHHSATGILHSGIAAIDAVSGGRDAFDFGPSVNAGEPVFIADPQNVDAGGWLITQTFDARTDSSGFAVFEADHVSHGPIATIALPSRMSMSFHGQWVAA